MATIDDLEQRGLIRRVPADPKAVESALSLARRDVSVARTILGSNSDWAYTIAYNAMLQAARALMFAKGYRPSGNSQHIAVVRFAELFLDGETLVAFDRMRRKRHATVYDMAGTISELEAEGAITRADAFLDTVEALLR